MVKHTSLLLVFILSCLPGLIAAQQDARIGKGNATELHPVLTPNADAVYFVRPDHKNNLGKNNAADIWLRTRDAAGRWNRALNPGAPVNSYDADQLLGFSPDGEQMAILRRGKEARIDVLTRAGRAWKQVASTQVPKQVGHSSEVAYSLVSGDIIYSTPGREGSQDLYRLSRKPDGDWNLPMPLLLLNTEADEKRPTLAADGRTLYFFRSNDGWYKQTDRGAAAELTRIPIRAHAIALGLNDEARNRPAVVGLQLTIGETTGELRGLLISPLDYPPAGRVTSTTGSVASLTTGTELSLRNGPAGPTTIFLRNNERVVDGNELQDLAAERPSVGGTAMGTTGTTTLTEGYELLQLERRMAVLQTNLEDLRVQRSALFTTTPEEYGTYPNPKVTDTLPPYGREPATDPELEAMRAKLRQHQRERRKTLDGTQTSYAQRERERKAAQQAAVRAEEERALALQRERWLRDSLDRASTLRRDLSDTRYSNNQRNWERDVQRGVRPSSRNARAEAERIDAEYARQLAELEQLKAELARLRGGAPPAPATAAPAEYDDRSGYPVPAPYEQRPATNEENYPPSNWTARSPAGELPAVQSSPGYAPVSSGRPDVAGERTYESSPAGTLQRLPISFIPNTAYVDGAGYGGLEALYSTVQRARGLVEIRIHTPIDMDRRHAQLLSEERATTIRDYLLERGIAERHFTVVGYGNNLTAKGGERVEVVER